MKQCPNCKKTYRDFDQYCMVCRYKLKYIEGSEKIEYAPEPIGNCFTNPISSSTSVVKCTYCGSPNTKKITVGSKAVHTALFGVFSMSRNSKQWHCNNCDSDF